MGQILQKIQEPEWLFSVVFMSVLASLVAAYLKDWIPLITSKFSARMRHRRHRSLVRMAKEVRRIKNDPRLLITNGVRVLVGYLEFVFVTFLTLAAPLLMEVYKNYPGAESFPKDTLNRLSS